MIIFIAVKSFIFQNYFVPVAGVLYPDSVVGTDSHTTMINGLGVVGYRIIGKVNPQITSTDIVLTVTKHLR